MKHPNNRWIVCLLLGMVLTIPLQAQEATDQTQLLGGDNSLLFPHLDFRAGYTASIWDPSRFGEWDVDSYGRNLAYAELSLVHPLVMLGPF